jgi:hypothetical protein
MPGPPAAAPPLTDPFGAGVPAPPSAKQPAAASASQRLASPKSSSPSADDALASSFASDFSARVAGIDQSNASKKAAMKEKAEEELDEHYAERTNRNAVRFSKNRQAESALLEAQQPTPTRSPSAQWGRVSSLIDVKAKEGDAESHKLRMRAIILQLQGQK